MCHFPGTVSNTNELDASLCRSHASDEIDTVAPNCYHVVKSAQTTTCISGAKIMTRTQVQFTEEQFKGLKELSQSSKEPIAALVRKAVDQLLLTRKPDRKAMYRQALSVIGKYQAGSGDVSQKHDQYLEEAYK
jgi:hypothetical protein